MFWKVDVKNTGEYPDKPLTVTLIGLYVAPYGTAVIILVAVALVTEARVAPKYTMLLAAVVLKFDPEMVTAVPTVPLSGVNDVMVGFCACDSME